MADARQYLRNKYRSVTDARELLQMKYAAKRNKNVSPMNRVTPMRSDSYPVNRPATKRKFLTSKQFRTNKSQGFLASNNPRNINRRFSNQQFSNRNDFRNRRGMGRNSNIVKRRIQGVPQFSGRGQTSFQSLNFRTTFTGSSRGNTDTRVVMTGKELTVRRNNLQRNIRTTPDGGDDLERMSLDDLRGLQKFPRSLTAKPFLSSSNLPRLGHFSAGLPADTMVADRYVNPQESTKLMVTGLLPSVSQEDILELFSNIGKLVSVEILSPGKVLVQYASATDAESAAANYDGVLLDGQAMKCHMLQSVDSGTSLASRLGDKSTATTSRFQYQPHRPSLAYAPQSSDSVKFIVNLPQL